MIADSQSSQESGSRPWYCDSEPEPASVGISKIWVHKLHRRTGVACKLLDCVRSVLCDILECSYSHGLTPLKSSFSILYNYCLDIRVMGEGSIFCLNVQQTILPKSQSITVLLYFSLHIRA